MDKFGIGSALSAMSHQLEQHSRRTGRTTAMCKRANVGDVILVLQARHIGFVRSVLRELGVQGVDVQVFSMERLHHLSSSGRTLHLEHTHWLPICTAKRSKTQRALLLESKMCLKNLNQFRKCLSSAEM